MLLSLVDTLLGHSIVESPGLVVAIIMISVILSEISTSGLDGHIAISGCPSMTHLLAYTFLQFGMVENCFSW